MFNLCCWGWVCVLHLDTRARVWFKCSNCGFPGARLPAFALRLLTPKLLFSPNLLQASWDFFSFYFLFSFCTTRSLQDLLSCWTFFSFLFNHFTRRTIWMDLFKKKNKRKEKGEWPSSPEVLQPGLWYRYLWETFNALSTVGRFSLYTIPTMGIEKC